MLKRLLSNQNIERAYFNDKVAKEPTTKTNWNSMPYGIHGKTEHTMNDGCCREREMGKNAQTDLKTSKWKSDQREATTKIRRQLLYISTHINK